MNTRSIRFRLITWYAGLLVVLVMAFGIYTFMSVGRYLSDSLRDRQVRRTAQIIRTLSNQFSFAGPHMLSREFEERYAPELNDRFIRVTTSDGRVLYVSGPPADRTFDPEAVPSLPAGAAGTVFRSVATRGRAKLQLVAVSFQKGGNSWWVEVGTSEAPDNAVLHGLYMTLLAGLSGVVIIAGMGGYILLTSALKPVREAIKTAQEITLLDLGKRLPVYPTGDEIETLSLTFNQMINRLDDYFQATRRFTSDASHELHAPLTIIQNDVEGLLKLEGLPPDVHERLDNLLKETERLSGIVRALLALSRLDADGLHRSTGRFDLSELTAETTERLTALASDKQIDLSFRTTGPAEISGDATRMKQVVMNLLDNAIKYTPGRGNIDVEVRTTERLAILTVSDTGPGVPEEALTMIFERFYRADVARSSGVEGAGLGLSIVSAICTAHGGKVRAENLPEGGCRFIVEIPLAPKK